MEASVGEYLQAWLGHARGRVRVVTWEGYEVLLRRHALPALGPLPNPEIVGLLEEAGGLPSTGEAPAGRRG